jgi:hypothetical protein
LVFKKIKKEKARMIYPEKEKIRNKIFKELEEYKVSQKMYFLS